MNKKFLALLLIFCLLLSLIPSGMMTAYAEDNAEEETADMEDPEISPVEEGGTDDFDPASVYEYLLTLDEESVKDYLRALSPEQYADFEQYVITCTEQESDSYEPVIEYGTVAHASESVNFSDAAPLIKQPPRKMLFAKALSPKSSPAPKDAEGLETSKTVTDNGDGTYTITLEAYTTGSVQTSTSAVPTDIILVLDQSGSMENTYKSISEASFKAVQFTHSTIGGWYPKNSGLALGGNLFYKLDNGTYSRVEVNWFLGTYVYRWTDENGEEQSAYGWGSLLDAPSELRGKVYRMSTSTTDISRLEALAAAATQFVNNVQNDAALNNVDHRIAVVGFASNGSTYNDTKWENTELLSTPNVVGYTSLSASNYAAALVSVNVNGSVNPRLTTAISRLDANGGTFINNGLEMAQGIFNNTDGTGRNRVVVILTDGTPGDGSWGNSVTGNSCASDAMNRAASLKNAGVTVYTVGIFDGADATSAGSNTGTTAQKTNYFMQQMSSNNGTVSNPSYYMSADNPEALNNIFESISEQIYTPSVDLGTTTVVSDVVTRYFDLPADASGIKVYTAASTGGENFSARTEETGLTPVIDGQKVTVTGFDFNENCVTAVPKADGTYGKKLIIEFTVTPAEGFLGGNEVPTNEQGGSGITPSGETDVIENFVPDYGEDDEGNPKDGVDVVLTQIDLRVPETNVYENDVYSDDIIGRLEVSTDGGNIYVPYDTWFNSLESWMQDYLKDIEPSYENGAVTLEFDPSFTGTVDKETFTAVVTVNVFRPVLTFKDATVEYGTAVDTGFYAANDLVSTEWKCGEILSTSVTMTGTEPLLSVSYDPVSVETPLTGGDIPVAAAVTTNGEASDAIFLWEKDEDCPSLCTDAPQNAQFRIHCLPGLGDLTIEKSGCEAVDENQSFIFHVTCTDKNVDMYVTIQGNGTALIRSIPIGSYDVEEVESWSWRYTSDGPKTVEVDLDGGSVYFDNDRSGGHWLNGCDYAVNTVDGRKNK